MKITHDEMIAVIQAHKDGKDIEFRDGSGWSLTTTPCWNFSLYDYRVKPEPPKPREWWIALVSAGINPPAFDSLTDAFAFLRGFDRSQFEVVHVREVLPE